MQLEGNKGSQAADTAGVRMSRHRRLMLVSSRSEEDTQHVERVPSRAPMIERRREGASNRNRRLLSVVSLAEFRRIDDEAEHRQRMVANGLGFAAICALIAFGVWLVSNFNDSPVQYVSTLGASSNLSEQNASPFTR